MAIFSLYILKLYFILFKFSGLSHDNNTNNSTNDGMDIEWRPKKEFYLESYSGRLINLNAVRIFLFSTCNYNLFRKKELSTIFVWENSVLGRNKTKIVKKLYLFYFSKLTVHLRTSGASRNRNWPGINVYIDRNVGSFLRFLEVPRVLLTNLCKQFLIIFCIV